jgi:hypothetical protein
MSIIVFLIRIFNLLLWSYAARIFDVIFFFSMGIYILSEIKCYKKE